MPYCSNCQSPVGSDDRVCPECGAVFQTVDGESDVHRESAGAVVPALAALAVLSALASLLLTFISTRSNPFMLLFAVLWGGAAVGIWRRNDSGLRFGVAVYCLAAVMGILSLVTYQVYIEALNFVSPIDPVSLFLSFLLQMDIIPRNIRALAGEYGLISLLIAVGSVTSGWLAWKLHELRGPSAV